MTLAASDRRLAQATVTLAGDSATNGFVNGHAMLHHRWFPRIELDDRDSLSEVVTMSGVNLDLGPAYGGSATLELFDSPSEELSSLAPIEILGGYFRSVGPPSTVAPRSRTSHVKANRQPPRHRRFPSRTRYSCATRRPRSRLLGHERRLQHLSHRLGDS